MCLEEGGTLSVWVGGLWEVPALDTDDKEHTVGPEGPLTGESVLEVGRGSPESEGAREPCVGHCGLTWRSVPGTPRLC